MRNPAAIVRRPAGSLSTGLSGPRYVRESAEFSTNFVNLLIPAFLED
jgi:hypothetical protein